MSTRGGWRGLLGGALVVAAGVFLGVTIARHWNQLEAFEWQVDWLLLALSVPALTASLGWGIYVWKLVLDRFDHPPIRLMELQRIWFLSNPARYIPGKIWQFVGAAELARVAGLSRTVILTSMAVHMGFNLVSAMVLSLVLLPTAGLSGGAAGAVFVSGLVLSIAAVHPAPLDFGLRVVGRLLKRDVLRWRGRWRDGVLIAVAALVAWLLYGLAFALFVHAVVGISPRALLPLAAVNALAFLVGYLVFLPPAGLGAREGAMAVLLRPFAPAGIAAVLAILSRLWTVAGELLGATLVLLLSHRPTRPPV